MLFAVLCYIGGGIKFEIMAYSKRQIFFLVLLRLFVGWHFLYEGLAKWLQPSWTARGYLQAAEGFLAPFFHWLGSDALLPFSNTLTILALLFVGLSLVLGIWEKWGAWAGMGLLAFFYLAYPPFPGLSAAASAEGNYFLVNKNLVELAALGVLSVFPSSQWIGLKALWLKQEQAHTS